MIRGEEIEVITVIDPVSGSEVDLAVIRLETGPIVGIDASYISQDVGPIYSPYDPHEEIDLREPSPLEKLAEQAE